MRGILDVENMDVVSLGTNVRLIYSELWFSLRLQTNPHVLRATFHAKLQCLQTMVQQMLGVFGRGGGEHSTD